MTAASLPNLPDRWRYPLLMPPDVDPGDEAILRRAILDGLADPVADPEDAAVRLLERGEFEAADLVAGGDDANRETVEEARTAAAADIGRRIAALRGRARRVNCAEASADEILEAAQQSRRLAEERLAQWASDIETAERKRAGELEDRLRALGDQVSSARADSVRRCISLGLFAEAGGVLDGGEQDETGGPARFPHALAWPWPVTLDWFFERPEAAPPRFPVAWRPADEDTDSWQLLVALKALIKDGGADAVRAMADALDGFLGNPEDTHRVEETGGGLRASIAGLRDSRLPNLALPWRMPLWFSPADAAPPEDFERPVIWLRTGHQGDAPQPGVAVLDVLAILTLVQLDDGQPASTALRRIRTLRAVCGQLRMSDLVGARDGLDLGHALDFRRDLAWLLDLLGVTVSPDVLDIISYDTGEHPVAIRVMLTALVPDQGRPAQITGESLRAWTLSEEAVASFRDAVLDTLLRDAETAAVVTTVLWAYADAVDSTFDRDNVEAALAMLAEFVGEPGVAAVFPYLPRALGKAVLTGLVQRAGNDLFRLGHPGLTWMLSAESAALESRAHQALAELKSGRDLLRRSLRSRLSLDAIRHLFGNHLEAFAQLAYSLTDQQNRLSPDLQEAVFLAVSSYERMEDYRRAAEADALAQLEQPRQFDLRIMLRETCEDHKDRRVAVLLEEDETPMPVRASRFMAKMAVENLIINARRAIFESSNPSGTVRVRAVRVDDAPEDGPRARIDIEDSGSGIPAELRRIVADLVSGIGIGDDRGSGLAQAKELLEHCGGTLAFIAEGSADLGGAHFQAVLPLERP